MDNNKSDYQNQTPSWKVNLTQKFNKFSQQKKQQKQKNKTKNFDKQLQQQLSFIPATKEQSSHKKFQLNFDKNTNLIKSIHEPLGKLNFARNNPDLKLQEDNNKKSIFDLSSVSSSSPKKLDFTQKAQHLQQHSQDKKEAHIITSIFTDQRISDIFEQYFQPRKSIQLSQFIDVCCLQFLREQKITPELKSYMQKQCIPIFCTTDQNLVSLNAIQLITKKKDIKEIIYQKYLYAKYKKRKNNLQKQYSKILEEIVDQQQALQLQNQKLDKRKKQIQSEQKQCLKKQKIIKTQQKELIQKQKYMKKTIQQKAQRLIAQINVQAQKQSKQIQKKASNFQRNARNKIQLIQKRVNDYKSIMIKNIPQKDTEQNVNRKAHNQILLLKNKLRKTEKELQQTLQQMGKQLKISQNQSACLLKANTLLESKLQKNKTKLKQIGEELDIKQGQVEQLKRSIYEKDEKINQFETLLLELQHSKTSDHYKQEIQIKHKNIQILDNNKKKTKSKSQRQNKLKSTSKQIPSSSQLQQSAISSLFQYINQVIGNINIGFINHNSLIQKQKQNNNKTISYKIEELLLQQSDQIVLNTLKIIWIAISKNIKQINSLVSFVIKLFLAKLSFVKFQSLTNNKIQQNKPQNLRNTVQTFIQKIQTECFKDNSFEQIFKQSADFIQTLVQNQPLSQSTSIKTFQFYILLAIAGFDQVFSLKKNKSVLIISLLKECLFKEIQHAVNQTVHNHIISRFQQQQFMSYLFCKYLSYSTSQEEVFQFVQIILQLCNYYCSIHHQNENIPLFRTILALDNYKYLFNFILINFSGTNLQKNTQLRQIFQSISIVLQRFCYIYGDKLKLDENDISQMKKIIKMLEKNQHSNDSLFKANLQNVLDKIMETN